MFYFDFASLFKYLLEGAGVALAAFYIPRKNINLQEVFMIALAAAATFALLDVFAPSVSRGARQGSGFGIGYNLSTGMAGGVREQFESEEGEGEEEIGSEDTNSN